VVYEKPIDLNPLETAIDEIRQKVDDFEDILKKKDLTLLELYLQGGIMPQVEYTIQHFSCVPKHVNIFLCSNQKVHKGPLAYAEAFLEPGSESNKKYSKELKRKFKLTFKKLIDLYQIGIELYSQLASKLNSCTDDTLNTSICVNTSSGKVLSSHNNSNANNLNSSCSQQHVEMHRLLQEKFSELENSFRNLLLIADDVRKSTFVNVKNYANSILKMPSLLKDLDLYHQLSISSRTNRQSQLLIGASTPTITSSSQA
jgi:hypothetical protein